MRPMPMPAARNAAARAEQAWQAGQKSVRKGRYADAVVQFQEASRWQPQEVLFGLNLADALMKSGDIERALEVAEAAARQDPHNEIAFALRGSALMRLHRHEELAQLLGNANPSQMTADAYSILGTAYVRLARPRAAIDAYLQALALKPAEADIHYRLGLAFNELKLKEEAAECFRTALLLGLGAKEAGVRDLLVFYERDVCDWRRAQEHMPQMKDAIARLPANAAVLTNPFAHVTLADDPLQQLHAARSCARLYEQSVVRLPAVTATARPRIRLGYVTADVRQHATAYLMAELLERHDRRRYEVTLYSYGREDDSPIRNRMVQAADQHVVARDMSPLQMARHMREQGIDIAVDLKGYTQDARPAVFAYRPAPVQVAYLGFPGTSGADFIDYVIGDPYVTPLESAAHFSEKIAQLPGCYQCNDGTRPLPVPPSRASQGLPEDALVLCGFNQAYKISPEVFDVWCSFLHRLPNAVLWLHSWNLQSPEALKREAVVRGVDPARLIFAPTMVQRPHLDRIACADLYLDTWPCNGHTTVSDMLWAGVPVVTWSGQTFASRVAGSLLKAVGVPDTVCNSVEAYEAKVMELALDAGLRQSVRNRVCAARLTSPLFNGERVARDIEALYGRMWERALAGLPPQHLPALAYH
jgi:predicted O-linked N-acetylglucosamine transferase (SPINDLY family)